MNRLERRYREKLERRRKKKSLRYKHKDKTNTANQTINSNTTLLQQALAYHQAGRLQHAERIYRHILQREPENADVNHLLGVIEHQAGRNEIAVQLISKAIEKDSNQPIYYNNLGNVLKKQSRLDDAVVSYRRALSIKPDYAEAHNNLGNALQEQGKLDDAVASYHRALSIKSDYADSHNNLGNALSKQGRLDDAMASYRRALNIKPNYAEAHNNLGNILKEQGRLDDAVASYGRALKIKSDYAWAHTNLGVVLQDQGRLDDALASFRKALNIKPNYAEAHRYLANLKQHKEYDHEIQAMVALHSKSDITDEQRMYLAFGLGKAFEDLGEYEKAFNFILEGNRLKRNTYIYNVFEGREAFNNLINVFDDQLFQRHTGSGFGDNTPIFIIGMLRSGSTLVEQILASHPQVHGAGELKDFKRTVIDSCEKLVGTQFPHCVERLTSENLEKLGADYIKELRQHSVSAKNITDKMLFNFLCIGIIRLILPNAKIVHCKRDPRDTCLSVFKNYFVEENKFAHDLSEIGEYYKLYHELMEHWHSKLPGYIFDIQYEEIIRDQEGETRRLLEYCELPWDEACLVFHKTVRPVRTVSTAQVRRPIYSSSVGLWKKYEKKLEPLLNVLKFSGL
ncbi:MAG: tetratricopeptide repeat protein [Desulfobacterales bacterium]|uniref:Tetratricopeptide repeat protein n=1 Tax=Candidatus Desulfatibia vada TaxID=2841696 RepID=A0A8J6NZY1_9BACT|nr:tetratricopeptide repeat protein [Candidatus Desulfatibia vada]MBL6970624.1 tetratricopeptide repeat protein [Desulfobacterales bacterium]